MGNQNSKSPTPYKKNGDNTRIVTHIMKQKLKNPKMLTKYQMLLKRCLENQSHNRALGCLFGSFIGDALGAYCQFSKAITPAIIEQTMAMQGGGVFSLLPGQFTDDSQMASHLVKALSTLNPQMSLEEQHFSMLRTIATEYVEWAQSRPFDMGITCRKGIAKLNHYKPCMQDKREEQLPNQFNKLFKEVLADNKESESNGSLMRITPMAVLFATSGLSIQKHQQFIKDQVRLLHPKDILQQAGYLWVTMLTKIINRADDQPQTFLNILEDLKISSTSHQGISEWFAQAQKEQRMAGNINQGWAKIAWSYGLRQLHKLTRTPCGLDHLYFQSTIKQIILEAGDTDTNAAIVGGLIGALIGFTNLPSQYIQKMMNLVFPQAQKALMDSQNRPHNYQPFWLFLNSIQFIDKSSKFSSP